MVEPWSLIGDAEPKLDLEWCDSRHFCGKQPFCDQKSVLFQLVGRGLREPERIDGLLLLVAIALLAGHLQGDALSLEGLRRQVDPHWQRE